MSAKQHPSSGDSAANGAIPVSIVARVGYSWGKKDEEHDETLVAARSDKRWQYISQIMRSVGEAVETIARKRGPAAVPFSFEVARIRGSHGQMLLDSLRERIRSADLLVMDIGSRDGTAFNYNVLLELGVALATQPANVRDVFILKPGKLKPPSDLNGFLFTDYELDGADGAIRILDTPGFRAAFRGAILRKARERRMIGVPLAPEVMVNDESDPDDAPDSTTAVTD